jgi:hypothetical protein
MWLTSVAVAALAAAPSPTASPAAPSAGLHQLQPFVGVWTCERLGPDPVRARTLLQIKPVLDGRWLAGEAREEPASDAPGPTARLFFWGYDEVLGKLVGGWMDNRGGWSTQTSMGWDEGRLVMLGHVTAGTEKVSARETFTTPDGGEFTRTYEVLGFIEWKLLRQERCQRDARPMIDR